MVAFDHLKVAKSGQIVSCLVYKRLKHLFGVMGSVLVNFANSGFVDLFWLDLGNQGFYG